MGTHLVLMPQRVLLHGIVETCLENINTNWFHYGFVGFNPDIDTDYYCSDNCRKERLDKYLYCTTTVNYKLSNYGGHDSKNVW